LPADFVTSLSYTFGMPGSVLLYLVRHAIAEQRGDAWPDDRLRPLTEEGRAKMERQVKGLAALGVQVDAILTSPLVRTRQTADILGQGLRGRPEVIDWEPLEPERRPKDVFIGLKAYREYTSLALVGHEPGIGDLSAALIAARHPVAFKKGAVALIEVAMLPPAAGAGELRWFLTPRILRQVAKSKR
jgi:phosphohistidine phosphatase